MPASPDDESRERPPVKRRRGSLSGVFARADTERSSLLVLSVLLLMTFGIAGLLLWNDRLFSALLLLVPLMLSDSLLSPRRVPPFVVVLVVVLLAETAYQETVQPSRAVNIMVILVTSIVVVAVSLRRNKLGVAGLRGASMLRDLQDRITRQGTIPPLPHGWLVDVATRSAGGTSFAGDFVVAHRSVEGRRLSVVLVDVSGKGVQAGTRSLLLSGALGGLIGALPPDRFLPAANDFLLRQAWDEGFATAVHLSLDLHTGDFELRGAGHPPAVQFEAGSGRWVPQVEASGPALGLLADVDYAVRRGRLGRGDVLMLYTDGLVERPRQDIVLGIDRLIGEGERLVRVGFHQAAAGLIERLGASGDDCALAIIHRRS